MRNAPLLLALCCGILASAGCLEKTAPQSPTLVNVSGKVQLDGQPAAGVRLLFVPAIPFDRTPGNRPLGFAVTDKEGHFVVKTNGQIGAVVGRHFVIASKVDPSLLQSSSSKEFDDKTKRPQQPTLAQLEREDELLPPEYNRNSSLQIDVPPQGMQNANFQFWLINQSLSQWPSDNK